MYLQGGYLTIRDPIMRLRCRSQVTVTHCPPATSRHLSPTFLNTPHQLQLLRHHEKNMQRLYDGLNALAATRWCTISSTFYINFTQSINNNKFTPNCRPDAAIAASAGASTSACSPSCTAYGRRAAASQVFPPAKMHRFQFSRYYKMIQRGSTNRDMRR